MLTYADVDRRADAMARGLLGRGLGPREVAGLWMQRGFDLLVAQIAIAKTGALPGCPSMPMRRSTASRSVCRIAGRGWS